MTKKSGNIFQTSNGLQKSYICINTFCTALNDARMKRMTANIGTKLVSVLVHVSISDV